MVQGTSGIQTRFGRRLPDDFGSYAQGSGSIASNIQGGEGVISHHKEKFGFYVLFLAEGKYVNYNYHIGKKVSPERKIGVLGIGFGFAHSGICRLPRMKFEICYIREGKDFEEQDGPNRYGTVNIIFPWNFE